MNVFADLCRPIINRPGMFFKPPAKEKPVIEKRIRTKSLAPRPAPKVPLHPFGLSDSQADMLNRLCAGEGNKDIARALGMTVAGVEAALNRAREKIEAKNRTHMAVLWDRVNRKAAG